MTLKSDNMFTMEPAHLSLCHDVPAEEAAPWIAQYVRASVPVFLCRATITPWKFIPSTYIIATEDKCFDPAGQRSVVKLMESMNPVALDVVEVPSSHSPFLSMPDKLAEILIRN